MSAKAGPWFRLLAITPPAGAVDVRVVQAWAAARELGLAVLLREPGTTATAMLGDGHRLAGLRRACAEAGVACLLSVDVGELEGLPPGLAGLGLAGVQLRGDPGRSQVELARRRLGPGRVLGRSCHGQPPVMGDDVDYSVFAPVFAPRTASPLPGPGKTAVGLPPLRAFAARQPHVFALGGVTAANAAACIRAGAYGLAAIRTFFGPVDEVADNVGVLVTLLTKPADHASPP
ncbi:MAG: thiamine phosphate synthase [Nannocystaceae bacterium]